MLFPDLTAPSGSITLKESELALIPAAEVCVNSIFFPLSRNLLFLKKKKCLSVFDIIYLPTFFLLLLSQFLNTSPQFQFLTLNMTFQRYIFPQLIYVHCPSKKKKVAHAFCFDYGAHLLWHCFDNLMSQHLFPCRVNFCIDDRTV